MVSTPVQQPVTVVIEVVEVIVLPTKLEVWDRQRDRFHQDLNQP